MNKFLKELREKHGYTQEYMAKKLGYKGKSGYCLLENGSVKITIEKARKISQIFNVDPSIFFDNEVEETSTSKKSKTTA